MTTLFLLFSLLIAPPQGANAAATDLTGKWAMVLDMSMGVAEPMLELTQGEGGKLTGTYTGRYGAFAVRGTLKASRVQFSFTMNPDGQPTEMTFAGEVSTDGRSMKGTAVMGELGEADWTAMKEKEKK